MRPEAPSRQEPASREDLAAALRTAADSGKPVRVVGGGTKLGWGATGPEAAPHLSTARLGRIVEHNVGDLTAVLEAGVPLAQAQTAFAEAGQMLALDPPDGGSTIGGVVATADSGPLRARYGGARDLVVGIAVALSDGSLAKAGGKVIKNVAGYDLAKLFAGSFGTLGAIVEVSVRLHPLPRATATAVGTGVDPARLARGASALAYAPLEHQGLDVRWEGGRGLVLARSAGAVPGPQAEVAAGILAEAGLETDVVEDDDSLWEAQRAGQRSRAGTVVRVSGLPTQLPTLLAAANRLDAPLVGRAALGLSWLRLEERSAAEAAAALEELRRELAPAACTLLDAPPEVRSRVDPWGPLDQASLELMRRVKERFDPGGICSPGVFAGGI